MSDLDNLQSKVGCEVFVGGCNPDIPDRNSILLPIEILFEHFSKFGEILDFRMKRDKHTSK